MAAEDPLVARLCAHPRWIVRGAAVSLSVAMLIAAGATVGSTEAAAPRPGQPTPVVRAPSHSEWSERGPQRLSTEELRARATGASQRPTPPVGTVFPGTRRLSATTAGLQWESIGPRGVWTYWSDFARVSGRVTSIAFLFGEPYVTAAQGGVWRLYSGTPLTDGLSSLASGWLTITNPGVFYYATGEQHYSQDSFYGDGIFRSDDFGGYWTKIADVQDVGAYIARLRVNPVSDSVIYVASDLGFVRSTDAGATWTVTLGGAWCNDIVVNEYDYDIVYCAMYGLGVYKSTDRGASWQLSFNPIGAYGRVNLAIAPSDPAYLYASFVTLSPMPEVNGTLHAMMRTTDGGASWTGLFSTPNYVSNQGWYDNALAVSPLDPNLCVAGGVYPGIHGAVAGLIMTTDGGTSWTDITFDAAGYSIHPDQQALEFDLDGRLWVCNDGGVYVTVWPLTGPGHYWWELGYNLEITQFYTVALSPDFDFEYSGPPELIGGSQDNGSMWLLGLPGEHAEELAFGDGGAVAFAPQPSPWQAYTTGPNMTGFIRWDTWFGDSLAVNGPWETAGDRADFANGPLVASGDGLFAGSYRVYRSDDLGVSWAPISGDLTNGGTLRSLAVSELLPDTAYSGSSDAAVRYTVDGATWQNRDPAALVNQPIPDIWMRPGNSAEAYLCVDTPGGLFGPPRAMRTTDAGLSWLDVTGDLPPGLRGLSLAVDWLESPPRLFLGTDYGVYSSEDGGVSWAEAGAGLPHLAIYDLAISRLGGYLVAATHGRGMWQAQLRPVPTSVPDPPLAAFELTSVSPNPGRPPIEIRFATPAPERCVVEIFDIAGRRVASLLEPDAVAGSRTLTWDGRATGPGIYFCRLRSNLGTRTTRFAVIR